MEITVAEERAWLLKEQLTMDHAEGRAWSRKMDAFGKVARVTSLLQRPKDDDFQLIYKEYRSFLSCPSGLRKSLKSFP